MQPYATRPPADSVDDAAGLARAVTANVEQVLRGKTGPIRLALTCLLAGGHLLIEDVPGTGKTSLAKGLAASFGGVAHRVQFTPDLLPTDMEGTYRLPEAQLDRFLMRIELGHPDIQVEEEILAGRARSAPPALSAVTTAEQVERVQRSIADVHVAPEIARYVARLAHATREHQALRLGVSTRGSLALLRAAQTHAACTGRHFVVPDDVKAIAPAVLTHRLVLAAQAEVRGTTAAAVLAEVIDAVRVPALTPSSA